MTSRGPRGRSTTTLDQYTGTDVHYATTRNGHPTLKSASVQVNNTLLHEVSTTVVTVGVRTHLAKTPERPTPRPPANNDGKLRTRRRLFWCTVHGTSRPTPSPGTDFDREGRTVGRRASLTEFPSTDLSGTFSGGPKTGP